MTKKNRKYLSKNNKKNAFYDKYTEELIAQLHRDEVEIKSILSLKT